MGSTITVATVLNGHKPLPIYASKKTMRDLERGTDTLSSLRSSVAISSPIHISSTVLFNWAT